MDIDKKPELTPEQRLAYLGLARAHKNTALAFIAQKVYGFPIFFDRERAQTEQEEELLGAIVAGALEHREKEIQPDSPPMVEHHNDSIELIRTQLEEEAFLLSMVNDPSQPDNIPKMIYKKSTQARMNGIHAAAGDDLERAIKRGIFVMEAVVNIIAPSPAPSHLPRS